MPYGFIYVFMFVSDAGYIYIYICVDVTPPGRRGVGSVGILFYIAQNMATPQPLPTYVFEKILSAT